MFDGQRATMAPNADPRLGSYQRCSEHSLSAVGRGVDGDDDDDDNGIVDVGTGLDVDNSMLSTGSASFVVVEMVHRRLCRRPPASLVVGIALSLLSVGAGWFASDAHSAARRRHAAGRVADAKAEVEIDGIDVPSLIWSDEFEGDEVDPTKWSFANGDGCDVGLCGWGNHELEWYTPSNARVSDGILVIEARKFETRGGPSPSYTSSKIVSRGKADFGVVVASDGDDDGSKIRSRRFEARLKLPWGRGIWPAFWMLPTYGTYGGWPKSGEIDIMENIGKEGPNTVHGTVHYGLDWPQHQYSESGVTPSEYQPPSSPSDAASLGNLNETFHTYAVERLPGEIRWYVDDVEYSSVTRERLEPYRWPFDEEFYFVLNLAVGGDWPGYPDDEGPDGEPPAFPQRLEVDYVRVYEDVFPRVVGKGVVGCAEEGVAYEVANVEADDVSYAWVVPERATIKEGQGTSRIVVDFDSTMKGGGVIDSDFIRVRAHIDDRSVSESIGLAKLKAGIGFRVKVVDFADGKCSDSGKTEKALRKFDFDCGRPSTCTAYVLHRTTEEYSCGERIEWLIINKGMDEQEACHEIGYKQFHGHCGPCNPLTYPVDDSPGY